MTERHSLKLILHSLIQNNPLPPIGYTSDLWTDTMKSRAYIVVTVHFVINYIFFQQF